MLNAVLQAGQIDIEPEEPIAFESRGRCLLIGPAAALNSIVPHLSSLTLYCLASDNEALEIGDSVTVIKQPLQSLSGWLGDFKARFGEHDLTLDLVLDLSESPFISSKVSPLGYFAPG